jgi:hypothetical protein
MARTRNKEDEAAYNDDVQNIYSLFLTKSRKMIRIWYGARMGDIKIHTKF